MNALRSMLATAALALVTPAQAGVNDPELIIYRASGVLDNGGAASTGTATAFSCTNFSGVGELIRVVVRGATGALLANVGFSFGHLETINFTTKGTALYAAQVMNTGVVVRGTAAIATTTVNITCTAMLVDAGASVPQGIALRMVRFNPIPGTVE